MVHSVYGLCTVSTDYTDVHKRSAYVYLYPCIRVYAHIRTYPPRAQKTPCPHPNPGFLDAGRRRPEVPCCMGIVCVP